MTGLAIERAALVAALADLEPADQACGAALAEGAAYGVSSKTTSVAELITVYDRRVRHLNNNGIETVGADTVIVRLRDVQAPKVRLGYVHSDDLNFTLFLAVDELAVLACIGVAASAVNPEFDWSEPTS